MKLVPPESTKKPSTLLAYTFSQLPTNILPMKQKNKEPYQSPQPKAPASGSPERHQGRVRQGSSRAARE